ncbi:cyclase family protein [Streptosporangium sp. NPDC001681]|uniref:cyclase family protein n=1 Tax=Streptosporangium sp. NPDC001681 TaxID=3154395 RepID=UPI00331ECBA9
MEAVRGGVTVYDLGRPFYAGMPQSPNHPAYTHTLPRRHGDKVRPDGGSAANDMLVMGTHVGTHIDALAHVSHDGRLHGGADAAAACVGGRYPEHGIHTVAPMVCRGVLLDLPAALGVACCEPGYEITPADLDRAVREQGTEVEAGDVVLIRSGWGSRFSDPDRTVYIGSESGVPGVGEAGAYWPAERGLRTKGAIAVGLEADLYLVDPDRTWTVRAAESESTQEYTPFEGFELTAQVTDTFVRGHRVLDGGNAAPGPPIGLSRGYCSVSAVRPERRRAGARPGRRRSALRPRPPR